MGSIVGCILVPVWCTLRLANISLDPVEGKTAGLAPGGLRILAYARAAQ
jgi:hypothetical protein